MGTYLTLELKDKSPEGIAKANALWTYENQKDGYRTAVQFRTKQDQLTDMEYMKLDDRQEHLREKSVEELEKMDYYFRKGIFHQKITLGDYLCSEMAKRILKFIKNHSNTYPFRRMIKEVATGRDLIVLFERPRDYVMNILWKTANSEHRAKNCFADCPYCRGLSTDMEES